MRRLWTKPLTGPRWLCPTARLDLISRLRHMKWSPSRTDLGPKGTWKRVMLCHTAAENQMHSGMKLMRGMRHGDAGCVIVVCISKISEWQPEFKAARSS